MPIITLPIILSVVRWLITMAGAYFAAKGIVSNDVVTALEGASGSVVSLVWSVITHQQIAFKDVANTLSDVAKSVGSISKDGETKDVVKQIQDILDKAKVAPAGVGQV